MPGRRGRARANAPQPIIPPADPPIPDNPGEAPPINEAVPPQVNNGAQVHPYELPVQDDVIAQPAPDLERILLGAKSADLINRVRLILNSFKTLTADKLALSKPAFDTLTHLEARFEENQNSSLIFNFSNPSAPQLALNETQLEFESLLREAQLLYLESLSQKTNTEAPLGNGSSVRLPKLNLPTFTGQIEQWRTFYNMFKSSVYVSKKLNKVEKFQYLISCLKSEPLDLIKGLDITEKNFDVAWDLLLKRYQSKRRHIFYHFNGLLSLPEIKSAQQAASLLSKYREHTQALDALDYPLENYDGVLTAVMIQKLSAHLRGRLEDYRDASTEYPTISEIVEFLEKEVISCDELGPSKKDNTNKATSKNLLAAGSTEKESAPRGAPNKNPSNKKTEANKKGSQNESSKKAENAGAPTPYRSKCVHCQEPHPLYSCSDFKSLSAKERLEIVKKLKVCPRCLNRHDIADCTHSHFKCIVCKSPNHHLLIHCDEVLEKPKSSSETPISLPSTKGLVGATSSPRTHVLLATCRVRLTSPKNSITVRGILDCAAQSTFLTTHCAKKLRLAISPAQENVEGISEVVTPIRGHSQINILSDKKSLAKNHEVAIIDSITGATPPIPLSPEIREKMTGLELADPEFDIPGPVDILIGAKLFPHLINGELISLGPSLPVAMGTKMGYVILGSTPTATQANKALIATTTTELNSNLDFDLQKFWQLEEPKPVIPATPELDAAERHFQETMTRLPCGRFMVRLPFAENPEKLGESQSQALRRFEALERKFQAKPDFRKEYVNYMEEYKESGYMVPASPDVLKKPHYFLSHHGVEKISSSTTKLRVVYDGSAATSNGTSLNSILHVGPKILNDIRDVLFNFRSHAIVMTCDVKKMYNCIALHPDDQVFQLILWRSNPSEPLQIYQMTCVTFGIACSAFLSIRSLHELAYRHFTDYPRAARAILDSFYVDDGCIGEKDREAAESLRNELVSLLSLGGFDLRKWKSNLPDVLSDLSPELLEAPNMWESAQTSAHSVLGLQWLPSEDCFSYKIELSNKPHTKRGLLSTLASIFCPAGWATPTIFVAKTLMQHLWLAKIGWDEQLPPEILKKWEAYLQTLPHLERVRLPRQLCPTGSEIQVHGFCDASVLGYAAVLYVRYKTDEHRFKTTLVTAKSKVAPLRHSTLPRLELCGAALLATVMDHIVPLLRKKFTVTKVFAWSDSTVVLHWIQTPSYKLKTFVANRIAHIQEILPETKWQHVKSSDNAADCCSRGLQADMLVDHELYWKGPKWLCEPEEKWPVSRISPPDDELPEIRPKILVSIDSQKPSSNLNFANKFSSWGKLIRVVGYVNRFIFNTKNPQNKRIGHLTSGEIQEVESKIVRMIQKASFPEEFNNLSAGRPCSLKIRRLNPFLDEHGTLRVGGRLSRSLVPSSQKFPAILPKDHPLVKLMINHYHRLYLHAGLQFLEAALAKQYWILSCRRAIRSAIFSCLSCFKVNPKNKVPLMSDLPSFRVTPGRPFLNTGVDFFGHYTVKLHSYGKVRSAKAYVCIFICMCTKAVHFEITEDLTAESFLAALTRFASRRGNPANVYCDNGSAFVGTSNELKRTVKSLLSQLPQSAELQKVIQERQINFNFNTPGAAHQGGLWESAIKIAKKHISRVLQGQTVSMEMLSTLTVRVEAMINSRPLVARSSDPSDLEPITPAHFLIGAALTTPLEPQHLKISKGPLPAKRWRIMQAMSQSIWKRWTAEYLHTLQSRKKWIEKAQNPVVGDLVLVQEPSSPPLTWKLGRITATFPGSQGQVRVAQIQTKTGIMKRPVSKLYPLPIKDEDY